MDSFEVRIVENPTEEGRAPDRKREYGEGDGDGSVTYELLFEIMRKPVGRSAFIYVHPRLCF